MGTIFGLVLILLSRSSAADELISLTSSECDAKLELRSSEPDLLIFRSSCAISLASLAQQLDEGLRNLSLENRIGMRSIQLGRLMNYPDWSKTLAITAAHTAAWNSRRGRPKTHDKPINRWVTEVLNGSAYPEALISVFEHYGLRPCISEVEKVLVFDAKDLLSDEQRRAERIDAEARLPFDAQIWLRLMPAGSDCRHPDDSISH